jgi:hypothetical protein
VRDGDEYSRCLLRAMTWAGHPPVTAYSRATSPATLRMLDLRFYDALPFDRFLLVQSDGMICRKDWSLETGLGRWALRYDYIGKGLRCIRRFEAKPGTGIYP